MLEDGTRMHYSISEDAMLPYTIMVQAMLVSVRHRSLVTNLKDALEGRVDRRCELPLLCLCGNRLPCRCVLGIYSRELYCNLYAHLKCCV